MNKIHWVLLIILGVIVLLFSQGISLNDTTRQSRIVIKAKDLQTKQALNYVDILCKSREDKYFSSGGITDSVGIARVPAELSTNLTIKAVRPDYEIMLIEIPHLHVNDTVTLYLVKINNNRRR